VYYRNNLEPNGKRNPIECSQEISLFE